MLRIIKAFTIVFLLLTPISTGAVELTVPLNIDCVKGDYEKMKKHFFESFTEDIILSGIQIGGKSILYVFVNRISSKWSVVTLLNNGIYCLIFYGDGLTPGHLDEVRYEQSH